MKAEDAFAEVRREFADGLHGRLRAIHQALAVLARGYDPAMGEEFYLRTHALKGTAASFGASELANHAALLEEVGRRWKEQGRVAPEEAATASAQLERLGVAIARYQAQVDAGGS